MAANGRRTLGFYLLDSYYSLLFILLELSFSCGAFQRKERLTECPSATPQSELNSFLWTLDRDPPSYFFGTIHVPYTRVWDYIPDSTKDAFRYSDNIYLELDLTDSSTAANLANCQLLSGGKTIDEYLPGKLFRRLNRYMEYIRRKIPDWMGEEQRRNNGDYYADYQYRAIVGSWQRMKPVWLMLLLNSLTENDVRLFGVPVLDLYLSRQAVQWQKNVGAIEKVDEQCAPLNKLNDTQVIFALDQTLRQHEERRQQSKSMPENDDLIDHYNCGDLKSVLLKKDTLKVNLTAMQQQEPELAEMAKQMDEFLVRELLYKRNELMTERIARLLDDNPSESFFFAFGAGHFLGNNSVIDRLASLGLPISHTKPESHVQNHSKRKANQGPFTHMDSSSLIASHPYIETMRKFDQLGLPSRTVRHGRGRDRKKSRRERPNRDDSSKSNEPDDESDPWIHIDEISSVTEEFPNYQLLNTATTPSSSTNQKPTIYLYILTTMAAIHRCRFIS